MLTRYMRLCTKWKTLITMRLFEQKFLLMPVYTDITHFNAS
jgi:hypothetical protein